MTPAKKRPRHLVPLPTRHGTINDGERARAQSGQTSVRVSRATLELLRRLVTESEIRHRERIEHLRTQAQRRGRGGWISNAYRNGVSLDELLYFDALQRIGELPQLDGES